MGEPENAVMPQGDRARGDGVVHEHLRCRNT